MIARGGSGGIAIWTMLEKDIEDIPKGDVRQIYSDVCEELFADELDIKQFTIAYSRPTTIGSVVAKSKLFQVEGKEVSKYITGELP